MELDLIKSIDSLTKPDIVKTFIKQNCDVCTGLGCFPDKCRLKLKLTAIPRASPSRRVLFKIKNKLKKVLIKLEEQQIIVPVDEPSEWTNNLVI